MKRRCVLAGVGFLAFAGPAFAQDSLPPLADGRAPRTHEELWAGFDPRAEPLDVEILKAWEEDGVVLQVLRYRIGTFKGRKAKMAAVYGYPKGGSGLPGLVQIHGGGQYADYRAPLTNAKRGYATLSMAWAGRINAPGYRVTPAEVRLFWDDRTDDPAYRVTTDWGLLDGYHAPTRYGGSFGKTRPAAWTLDAVESPRNNPWFLCTLGARRALTFLEQQPEVDPARLGVYGHSMGGKLTVLTAGADARVQAAVPSCGGISDRDGGASPNKDNVALKQIPCPILFQSPANDFHGRIDDLQTAVTEIRSTDWRVTCAAHHNHQDTAPYEVAAQLWFDQHLKKTFVFPETPVLKVHLNTEDGVPAVSVAVDETRPILDVDVYYTRHGQINDVKEDRENTKHRHWHYAPTTKEGPNWTARLPLSNTEQPLWVYANVSYTLEEPVDYAGYYYRVGSSETFNLSSLLFAATGEQLQAAGVKATLEPTTSIETFEGEWEKAWFTYRPEAWGRSTHKLYDESWKAPEDARLAFDVRAERGNTLVVAIDSFATEVDLSGGERWQPVVLSPEDFTNVAGDPLETWTHIRELRLDAAHTLKERVEGENRSVQFGGAWTGADPTFRNLRWLPKGPWAITPDPALPNVLVLGGSISIGYTLHVRRALSGEANVFRPNKDNGQKPENCEGTTLGVAALDRWLAGRTWDVIHFNWGLHDLKHVHPETGRNSPSLEDPHQADPETYRRQLSELVDKLKAAGATLIFATTTPFPDGTGPARLAADARRYNGIALDIMKTNHIRVNDLYALTEGRLGELQHPKNVHFNQHGNTVLGDQVVAAVQAALKERQ